MTEREITAIFKRELINEGADYILYMACASGQGGYDQIINNPCLLYTSPSPRDR